MPRAQPSGIRLSREDAAIAKAMLQRGDRQHDVAAWFGVNGGRIADISTGVRFGDVKPARGSLPPPGPYLAGRDAHAAMFALEEAGRTINTALALIRERTEAAERSPRLVPEEKVAD